MYAMKVGVIANIVTPERGDHILAAPLFQDPCFLPYDFEGGLDSLARQKVSQAQDCVVTGRENIIFGVEPEDNVNWAGYGLRGVGMPCLQGDQKKEAGKPKDGQGATKTPGTHTLQHAAPLC
jgi:hypothetical protein